MSKTRGSVRIADNEWVKGQYKHGFMAFIHAVNRVCREHGLEPVFGTPTQLGDWWVPGMYAEQYPRARVIYTKGTMEERIARGEGYRIVTGDEALFPIWDEAWEQTLPLLEIRDSGNPKEVQL